jgi:hypothetical protein
MQPTSYSLRRWVVVSNISLACECSGRCCGDEKPTPAVYTLLSTCQKGHSTRQCQNSSALPVDTVKVVECGKKTPTTFDEPRLCHPGMCVHAAATLNHASCSRSYGKYCVHPHTVKTRLLPVQLLITCTAQARTVVGKVDKV